MNEQPCYLRRATPDDVDALADLLEILFSIETEFIIHREAQVRGLVMFLNRDDSVIFCAEIEGRVVGMCSAQCLVSTAMGGLSAFVEDLVVHEDHRGKGIGARLLSAIERWAKGAGAGRLQLLADIRNRSAMDFYSRGRWDETRMVCRRKYVE